jgi:plastocyanin
MAHNSTVPECLSDWSKHQWENSSNPNHKHICKLCGTYELKPVRTWEASLEACASSVTVKPGDTVEAVLEFTEGDCVAKVVGISVKEQRAPKTVATPERLKLEQQAEALYEFYRKEHQGTCPDVPWIGLFGDTQEMWIKEAEKANKLSISDDAAAEADIRRGEQTLRYHLKFGVDEYEQVSRSAYEYALAYIATLESTLRKEWQSIQTAPKDQTDVLVWLRGNRSEQFNERAMVCRHDGYSGWCIPGVGGLSASHWMAAPCAPDAAVKQP